MCTPTIFRLGSVATSAGSASWPPAPSSVLSPQSFLFVLEEPLSLFPHLMVTVSAPKGPPLGPGVGVRCTVSAQLLL